MADIETATEQPATIGTLVAPAPAAAPARTWHDVAEPRRADVPAGMWTRCPGCEAMLYQTAGADNLHVCTKCGHHFRVDADQRIQQLCDPDSFEPLWEDVMPVNTLEFTDARPYADRLVEGHKKTGHRDALLAGRGFIKGRPIVLACMDNRFMMGSMGCVVGEKITRAIELALAENKPLVIVSCSGGARMQEGTLSLMQMAKTSAALARLDAAGGLFISVLTDPTTGGVSASFAMLGDVILAEPGAMIGFCGPRVIANTIRQELPDGFQRAEHLMEKGFIDRVVRRQDLRSEISRLIDYAGK